MIIFFGPAGAGKSVQGQLLAARHGWRWLSTGQLLRDSRDPDITEQMRTGELVGVGRVNDILLDAIRRSESVDKLIIDGFPRLLQQAKWLVESQATHERSIQLVVVLDVPEEELRNRLLLRGRVDDTAESIDERHAIYHKEIDPILDYFTEQGIAIAHVDGSGTVGQVHDKIESALIDNGVVVAE